MVSGDSATRTRAASYAARMICSGSVAVDLCRAAASLIDRHWTLCGPRLHRGPSDGAISREFVAAVESAVAAAPYRPDLRAAHRALLKLSEALDCAAARVLLQAERLGDPAVRPTAARASASCVEQTVTANEMAIIPICPRLKLAVIMRRQGADSPPLPPHTLDGGEASGCHHRPADETPAGGIPAAATEILWGVSRLAAALSRVCPQAMAGQHSMAELLHASVAFAGCFGEGEPGTAGEHRRRELVLSSLAALSGIGEWDPSGALRDEFLSGTLQRVLSSGSEFAWQVCFRRDPSTHFITDFMPFSFHSAFISALVDVYWRHLHNLTYAVNTDEPLVLPRLSWCSLHQSSILHAEQCTAGGGGRILSGSLLQERLNNPFAAASGLMGREGGRRMNKQSSSLFASGSGGTSRSAEVMSPPPPPTLPSPTCGRAGRDERNNRIID